MEMEWECAAVRRPITWVRGRDAGQRNVVPNGRVGEGVDGVRAVAVSCAEAGPRPLADGVLTTAVMALRPPQRRAQLVRLQAIHPVVRNALPLAHRAGWQGRLQHNKANSLKSDAPLK